MKVQCLACARFTFRPRDPEDGNERLRDADRARAAIGWGRCELYAALSMHWLPADTWRDCGTYTEAAAELVDARRAFISKQ